MDKAADQPDALLERLLFAIDNDRSGEWERAALEKSLFALRRAFETERHHASLPERNRRKPLLERIQANIAERRQLHELLGPFGRQEIARAEWSRVNLKPTLRAVRDATWTGSIEAEIAEKFKQFKHLEWLELAEYAAIGIVLDEMQRTYKRDAIYETP
jgi:hypothetical protein